MSDARPITNVTEFVCGACWNSFSRKDPDVLQGDDLCCPHCGHLQPLRDTEEVDLHALVRQASGRGAHPSDGALDAADGESDEEELAFRAASSPMTISGRPVARGHEPAGFVVGAATDADLEALERPVHRAAPSAPTAGRDAVKVSAGNAQRETGPRARLETAQEVALPRPTAPDVATPPPWMVDDSGDGFDFEGMGLDDETLEGESLDAPRVAGELGFGASDEPTDPDIGDPGDSDDDPGYGDGFTEADGPDGTDLEATRATGRRSEPAWADTMSQELAENLRAADDPEATLDDVPSDAPQAEPTDWKIKAPPGLTYNFHSLDAMLGWAANKTGAEMQVSADGSGWHDFELFMEGVRAGLSASRALAMAAQGTSPALVKSNPPTLTAFDEIQQVDAREEMRAQIASRADPVAPKKSAARARVDSEPGLSVVDEEIPTPASDKPDKPTAQANGAGRRTGRVAPVDLRQTGGRPSGPLPAGARRASGVHRGATAPPAAQTPARPPAAKRSAISPVTLAAVGLVLLVVAIGALHFSGTIRIPGLP